MRPCDYKDGYDDDYSDRFDEEVAIRCDQYPQIWLHLADVVERRCLAFLRSAMDIQPQCESPIEVELGAHLTEALKDTRFHLVPQYEWQGFRNDFAILLGGRVVAFIECDGKEFHSTADQIARDRRKDAVAKADGILLLRFTGSEIFHNAKWIARLVHEQLERAAR